MSILKNMHKLSRVCLVLIGFSLAACGARSAAVTAPARTSVPPPAPATEVLPPKTGVPTTVTTPAVVASSAASAQPAPTVTPAGRLGPDHLPDDLNPLTGEVVTDPVLLDLRPLAVKIVNEPACARPQYGLNRAALVFEHYVEAWGTRFTAIYYGHEATKIGAVRSARLIDLELPAIFDAILVTSGSSGGVKQRLLASDFSRRIISFELGATCPPLCHVPVDSVACADLEHSMFTDLRELHAQAAESGLETQPRLSGWAFSAAPLLAGGKPALRLHVNYLNSPVDWTYDPESGNYLRSQDGNRHVDAETGMRLTAQNVVVLFAHHLYSDIRESTNFYSLEIQFWGQGPALVYRDGQAFDGMWLRPERGGLFRLVDSAGAPMTLKPGRTWFEFVALDSGVEAGNGEWTITAAILPQQTPPRP